MIKRLELLYTIFNQIDLDILLKYNEDLSKRILLQKIVYFVQEGCYYLGIRFCLYPGGPYCSELADYMEDNFSRDV